MNYEQRYKDILERARTFVKRWDSIGADDSELVIKEVKEIFPELKESEDEQHRKWILDYLYDGLRKSDGQFKGQFKTAIAWLEKQGQTFTKKGVYDAKHEFEKQGEQDTPQVYETKDGEIITYSETDGYKIEPKFKVGDWIIQENIGVYKVIEVCESWYEVVDNKDKDYSIGFDKEYMCHLWSITDAKDGDVLEFADHGRLVTGILSFVNKTTGKVDVSCLLEGDKFKIGVFYNLDTVKPHPATKEQRALLFQKMRDAGYRWDDKKKEPIRI